MVCVCDTTQWPHTLGLTLGPLNQPHWCFTLSTQLIIQFFGAKKIPCHITFNLLYTVKKAKFYWQEPAWLWQHGETVWRWQVELRAAIWGHIMADLHADLVSPGFPLEIKLLLSLH